VRLRSQLIPNKFGSNLVNFYRKSVFAEENLGWTVEKVVITPAIDKAILKDMRS
jgi:hypothetical protein